MQSSCLVEIINDKIIILQKGLIQIEERFSLELSPCPKNIKAWIFYQKAYFHSMYQ